MRNIAAWCLFAVLLLSYTAVDAQVFTSLNRYRKNEKKVGKIPLQLHKRLYLGVYGVHFMENPIDIRIRDTAYPSQDDFNDRINGTEVDTSFTTTARLTKALTGYLGVSVPFARPTETSMLCLDIEANILMGELSYDTVTVPLNYKDLFVTESMPFMMASAPVSVNFKYGGDASLSKDHRTLLSAGAGIATSYITIDDGSGAEALIKGVPFVKAEIGFLFGVAIKLRGTAYLGNYNLIDYTSPDISTASGIISRRYSGQLGYNLSVIIMPLSFMWDKPLLR